MSTDPLKSINDALRQAHAGNLWMQAQLLSLRSLLEEVANKTGVTEFQGRSLKQAYFELTHANAEKILLSLGDTNPSLSEALQEELKKAKRKKD